MAPKPKADGDAHDASTVKVNGTEGLAGSATPTPPAGNTSSNREYTAPVSILKTATFEIPKGRHVTFSADCKPPAASGPPKKPSPRSAPSFKNSIAVVRTSRRATPGPEPQLSLAMPSSGPPETTGEQIIDFQQVDSMEGVGSDQETNTNMEQIRDTGQPEHGTATWEHARPPTWNANVPGQSGHQIGFIDDTRDIEMDNAAVGDYTISIATPENFQPSESQPILFQQDLDCADAAEESGGLSAASMLAEAFSEVPVQSISNTNVQPSTPLDKSVLNATTTTEILLDAPELPSPPENQVLDHNHQPSPTTAEVAVENIFPAMSLEDWQALQQYTSVPSGSTDGYVAPEDSLTALTSNDVYPNDGEVPGEDIEALIQEAADFPDSLKNMGPPSPPLDVNTTSSGYNFPSDNWDYAASLVPDPSADIDGLVSVEAQVVDEDEQLRLKNSEMDRYFDFDAVDDSNGAILDHHHIDSGEAPQGADTDVENNTYIAAMKQMENNPYSMPQASPAYTQWQAPQPPSMSQSHITSAAAYIESTLLNTDTLTYDSSSAGYRNSTSLSPDTMRNLLSPPRPSTSTRPADTFSVNSNTTSSSFIPGLTLSPPPPTTAAPNLKPDTPSSPVSYNSDYEEEKEPPLPEDVADRLRQKMNAQTHVTFYQSVQRDEEALVRTGKNPELSKMVLEEAKTSLGHWSAELSRVKKTRYEKKDQQYKGHTEHIAIKREVGDINIGRLRAQIFQTAQARFDAAAWQARLDSEENGVQQQSPALPTPPVSPLPPPPQSGFGFQFQSQISFSAAASQTPKPVPNGPFRFIRIGGEEEENDGR